MIIYGKNVIKEAIFAKRPIYKVYVDEKTNDYGLLEFFKDKAINYLKTDKGTLNQMTHNAHHQGVVAEVKPYGYHALEDILDDKKIQRFLILDQIEDPHNLGAIMRTAEACQYTGIILSKKGQVPLNATVAKVSSGAIEHIPVILVSNIHQTLIKLKALDIVTIGTDGTSDHSYEAIPKDQSIAIVLGNEGDGIRPLVKKQCDMLVKIPMYGKINSLNVSVAAALMMYQSLS